MGNVAGQKETCIGLGKTYHYLDSQQQERFLRFIAADKILHTQTLSVQLLQRLITHMPLQVPTYDVQTLEQKKLKEIEDLQTKISTRKQNLEKKKVGNGVSMATFNAATEEIKTVIQCLTTNTPLWLFMKDENNNNESFADIIIQNANVVYKENLMGKVRTFVRVWYKPFDKVPKDILTNNKHTELRWVYKKKQFLDQKSKPYYLYDKSITMLHKSSSSGKPNWNGGTWGLASLLVHSVKNNNDMLQITRESETYGPFFKLYSDVEKLTELAATDTTNAATDTKNDTFGKTTFETIDNTIKTDFTTSIQELSSRYRVVLFGYGASGSGKTYNMNFVRPNNCIYSVIGIVAQKLNENIDIPNVFDHLQSATREFHSIEYTIQRTPYEYPKDTLSKSVLQMNITIEKYENKQETWDELKSAIFKDMIILNDAVVKKTPNNDQSTRAVIMAVSNDLVLLDLPGLENFHSPIQRKRRNGGLKTVNEDIELNNAIKCIKNKGIICAFKATSKTSFTQYFAVEKCRSGRKCNVKKFVPLVKWGNPKKEDNKNSKKNTENETIKTFTLPEFFRLQAESYWINNILGVEQEEYYEKKNFGNVAKFLRNNQLGSSAEEGLINFTDSKSKEITDVAKVLGTQTSSKQLKYVMLATVADTNNYNTDSETRKLQAKKTLEFVHHFSSSAQTTKS